jgi:prevent-host-death family protein
MVWWGIEILTRLVMTMPVRPPRRASTAIVNVAAAKARLPELIERAARGEEIVLARAGRPRARLVPLANDRKALRVPGKGKGRFRPRAGFDAELSAEVLALFHGSDG